ncbi:met-10+ like protein, putative [Plasmodium chabaudi chabaudi]|uniref:tRNA (guanine(37)-N1)-methyltransferase n=1 Tax=Plasmodium chabaudi chabaudi TaxID=31271 RepID=A0A4V0K6N8_PLACU|nr:met-10+ like protein, putative [Plasmodium chabaudi chabaudi]VTZ68364.1 met-10+ like protein, putative [Plasmodium chabaudi chabaudi]|eukprot:XP_016653778.1 met-10+ like protein, putative [Plasmodium chabaudi chabaudi]
MLFKIAFIVYFLFLNYVHLLKKNKRAFYNFQIMDTTNIKSLNDVKEKLKYKKEAYCLLLNKYKVNDILKNKYVKFWLLNIYKFPSVLVYNEYKNLTEDRDGESILKDMYSYFEKKKKGETLHEQLADNYKDPSISLNNNIVENSEDDIFRLVPLNNYFNKVVKDLFNNEESIYADNTNNENKDKDIQSEHASHLNLNNTEINDDKKKNSIKRKRSIYEMDNDDEHNIYGLNDDKKYIDMENIYKKNKLEYAEELFNEIKKNDIKIKVATLDFGYENMNTSEVLRQIFPSINEIIHKFEIIGHIAHLNFCNKLEDCKKIIAEVILDKNKSIKTVINKKDILNNVHRTFNIELLAGEKNYITELKENNIKIKVNYELMYWNSKLKKERDRIYSIVQNNSIIIDVFGGVGIFSLLLSSKSCLCFSNDINKHAYDYMNINIDINKKKNILTYNLDGRKFIEKMIDLDIFSIKDPDILTMYIDEQNKKNISMDIINSKDHALTAKKQKENKNNIYRKKKQLIMSENEKNIPAHYEQDTANYTLDVDTNIQNEKCNVGNSKEDPNKNTHEQETQFKIDINLSNYNDIHVLMNLPQLALDFLDVFKKIKKKTENDKIRNIFIHCYYFSNPESFYEHAEKSIMSHFKKLPKEMKVIEIRKVAPNKLMYAVEFNLKELLEE